MSQTNFGFKTVDSTEKASLVKGVFDSVAPKYDLMNDLMSMGLHRVWKAYTMMVANVQPGMRVLDIAGGTGDLAMAMAPKVGNSGCVVHTDINFAMLQTGRKRLQDKGILLPTLVCDAEHLPFADDAFDLVTLSFGLRNMTNKEKALQDICRVLKPGGRLLVLEFSKVAEPLTKPYDWYSFQVLPKLGQFFANDAQSYRYLAESIRMHPDQASLKKIMHTAGFSHVDIHNLTGGVAALHMGIKC